MAALQRQGEPRCQAALEIIDSAERSNRAEAPSHRHESIKALDVTGSRTREPSRLCLPCLEQLRGVPAAEARMRPNGWRAHLSRLENQMHLRAHVSTVVRKRESNHF